MTTKTLCLLIWAAAAAGGCANSAQKRQTTAENKGRPTQETLEAYSRLNRPLLARAELTTAVDRPKFRSAAPPARLFYVDQKEIFFVGRLKNLPAEAVVEVRWFYEADAQPMVSCRAAASDSYQFIAAFSPPLRTFDPGSYTARVFVNGNEAGALSFAIEPRLGASDTLKIRALQVSRGVTQKMRPKQKTSRFEEGVSEVWASFAVTGSEPGTKLLVRWQRAGERFFETELDISRSRRYSAKIEAADGLPPGSYDVTLVREGRALGHRAFVIGLPSTGPRALDIALGTELSPKTGMPREESAIFGVETPVVVCGLRCLDLPPGGLLKVIWVRLEEDEEVVLFVASSTVQGGSGPISATWNPSGQLEPGKYKAAAFLDDKLLAEKEFEVR